MLTKMPKILLVGSGITSSLVASLLHQKAQILGHERNSVEISIWDKARGTGGRMSTSRSPLHNKCTADLGAQYISCTPQYTESHKIIYEELLQVGILEPLKQTITNAKEPEQGTNTYVVPDGMSSLVKYFTTKSKLQPSFEHHVSEIKQLGGKWHVTTLAGKSEVFDAVVLTMPVPQLLNLNGLSSIFDENIEMKKKLEAVSYSSRYALGLFYDEGASLNLPFSASYLYQDPVFRFIAVDNVKRNRPELPISVVLHTSVPFGLEHIDKTVGEVEPILKKALQQSFPNLPPPKAMKCHKWKFSQVFTPYSGQPGVIELCRDPLLLAGGDSFTHSNFDGCISSAESIVNALS